MDTKDLLNSCADVDKLLFNVKTAAVLIAFAGAA